MRFDPIWMQAISELLINMSVFFYGLALTVLFSDKPLFFQLPILTADVLAGSLMMLVSVKIRRGLIIKKTRKKL